MKGIFKGINKGFLRDSGDPDYKGFFKGFIREFLRDSGSEIIRDSLRLFK